MLGRRDWAGRKGLVIECGFADIALVSIECQDGLRESCINDLAASFKGWGGC